MQELNQQTHDAAAIFVNGTNNITALLCASWDILIYQSFTWNLPVVSKT